MVGGVEFTVLEETYNVVQPPAQQPPRSALRRSIFGFEPRSEQPEREPVHTGAPR
jgi:hypothetical protein